MRRLAKGLIGELKRRYQERYGTGEWSTGVTNTNAIAQYYTITKTILANAAEKILYEICRSLSLPAMALKYDHASIAVEAVENVAGFYAGRPPLTCFTILKTNGMVNAMQLIELKPALVGEVSDSRKP